MTRETKVGLLVGMGVILLIGIIVSDHLAIVDKQRPADGATSVAERAQESIHGQGAIPPPDRDTSPGVSQSQTGNGTTRRPERRERPTPRNRTPSPRDIVPLPRRDNDRRNELPAAYATTSRNSGDASAAASNDQGPSSANTNRANNTEAASTRVAPNAPDTTDDESASTRRSATSDAADNGTPSQRTSRADSVSSSGHADSAEPTYHQVAAGETLYEIAKRYYGDGSYWRMIQEHNPDKVRPNGHVNEHVRLTIPLRGEQSSGESARRDLERRANAALAGDSNAPSSDNERAIEVAPQDTLSGLAARHLGSAGRWRELLRANSDKLDAATDLRAGMTLRLPESSGNAAAASQAGTNRDDYTVQPGDTLVDIAEKVLGDGGRWREIYNANKSKLDSADRVVVGQTLRIPS